MKIKKLIAMLFCLLLANNIFSNNSENVIENKNALERALCKCKSIWWKLPGKARNTTLIPVINGTAFGFGLAAESVFGSTIAYPLSTIVAGSLSPALTDMVKDRNYLIQTGFPLLGILATAGVNYFLFDKQSPYASYQYFIAWALINLKHFREMRAKQPLTQEQEQAMQELQEIAHKAQITEDVETGKMGDIVHEEA